MIFSTLAFLADQVLEAKGIISLSSVLGLHLPESDNFHWWQYFSYIFMHGSFMHIALNMFAFWMFGNVLENVWGPKKFFIYFIVTGVGAGLVHTAIGYYEISALQQKAEAFYNTPSADAFAVFVRDNIPYQYLNADYAAAIETLKGAWYKSTDTPMMVEQAKVIINEYIRFKADTPTVGASGSVFGLLLAFGMLFPNTIIYIYFAIPMKAKYFVMLYGAIELYSAYQNNPTDNVAHFAHLGGMLFGFILIKFWNKTDRSSMY